MVSQVANNIVCRHLPDLNFHQPSLVVFLDVDVDWEMSVDVSHLVLVALCHAGDQVLNDRFDCAQCSDILSRAVVDLDLDDVCLW